MLTRQDLQILAGEMRKEITYNGESPDYARGLKQAASFIAMRLRCGRKQHSQELQVFSDLSVLKP